MPLRQITDRSILRVLALGFALVIVLLVAAAVIGVTNIHAIREAAASLAAEHSPRAEAARREIQALSNGLVAESLALLGACLLAALVSAILTVRMTTNLFRRMEWQTAELGRVSWQMLENQENAARRFSHELHDELGQSLAAVKANLSSLQAAAPDRRVEDCLKLVDEAIGNVRELSQLLHPNILDDFGLSAALRWLAEGFTERTGTAVDYHSEFSGRLAEDIELHLFRITQEAFTNVARHSGARRVDLALTRENGSVRLRIADDGRGLDPGARPSKGLGMIGMRARARNAGGELAVRSTPGRGVAIEVRVPARTTKDETPNPHSAG